LWINLNINKKYYITFTFAKKERFKIIPAVYLVLKKDGKMLLSRGHDARHEDGNYSLVSGNNEGNESLNIDVVKKQDLVYSQFRIDTDKTGIISEKV
jgi:hypothetical protein